MREHPRVGPPLPGFSPRAVPERGYCVPGPPLPSGAMAAGLRGLCDACCHRNPLANEMTSSMWASGDRASVWPLGSPRALLAAEAQDVHCPGLVPWDVAAGRRGLLGVREPPQRAVWPRVLEGQEHCVCLDQPPRTAEPKLWANRPLTASAWGIGSPPLDSA